jgi:hypothetical protein
MYCREFLLILINNKKTFLKTDILIFLRSQFLDIGVCDKFSRNKEKNNFLPIRDISYIIN